MPNYPSTQNTDDNLYVGVNNLSTVLDGGISAVDTTITVSDTTGFPTVGIITIDLEAVHYTGTTATTFTGCTRGFDGTTGAVHNDTATVFHDIPAAHHNVLKDEIKAISDDLRDSFTADLDDAATIAATATDIKERLDQIVTQIKNITAEADWKTTPGMVHLAGSETITGAKTFSSDLTMSGSSRVFLEDGSAGTPSLTFNNDTDAGIYRNSDEVNIASGGVQIAHFDGGGIKVINGSALGPSFSFINDTDTGIYTLGSGFLNFSCNNTETLRLDNTRGLLTLDGTESTPSISFLNDTDTGIYRPATNEVGFATNGLARWRVTSGGIWAIDSTDNTNGKILAGAGSTANPTYSFNVAGATDVGMFLDGSSSLSFNISSGGNFNFYEGGTQRWRYDGGSDEIVPLVNDDISLGSSSLKWSDVQSVLINGADYGFANGYILREYPCTEEDVHTKSNDWMKENANKGIQIINDKKEMVAVIGRDGTFYAKDFKPLSEIPN